MRSASQSLERAIAKNGHAAGAAAGVSSAGGQSMTALRGASKPALAGGCAASHGCGVALRSSFALRFEFALEPMYRHMLLVSLPVLGAVKFTVFRGFALREQAWRYVGFPDLVRIAAANLAASAVATSCCAWRSAARFPARFTSSISWCV